jgi:Holliday junction resolvase RusA-like endonuclease
VNAVTFFVAGIPQPQGSKTAFVVKGRAVVVDKNPKLLKPWRAEITRVAGASWADRPQLVDAVRVDLIFVMPRGKTVTRRFPSVKPDVDKLERAVLDGITDARVVWRDDAQVVRVVKEQVYGGVPGVHVTVQEMSVDVLTRGERWLAEMGLS